MANEKVPIVVGIDGTYTRATSETFRKIAEGCVIEANAIIWVRIEVANALVSGDEKVLPIGIVKAYPRVKRSASR